MTGRLAMRVLGTALGWALCGVGVEAADPSTLPEAPAAITAKALEAVRHLAILHNGRLKPFDSFARETLTFLTGSSRLGRRDPVATVLSVAADPSAWADADILSVPFGPLRQPLGLQEKTTHASYNGLVSTRQLMRMLPAIAAKQQREEKLTVLENEVMDLYGRFVAFTHLMQQEFRIVPPSSGTATGEWMSVLHSPLDSAWESLIDAFKRGDSGQVIVFAGDVRTGAARINPAAYPAAWRLRLEVLYNRLEPFRLACMLYALSAVLLLIGWSSARAPWSRAGMALFIVAGVVQGAGILCRVVLGGRPPVSNFYETTLWLPFVAVVLALVFERLYRVRVFALAAAILAAIALALADRLPLDASISPVVAVLRSNLWLTIHVLTIVASYGALALATVLAHLYGLLYLRQARHPALASLDTLLYRAIQVGVVLLAGGIMLGAVWANASWGRYWGWDPKETWALITLLWFLAVLHGRFAGWITGVGVALATIGGFFLLLMTYYGVSFYLVGLHSYAGGHATPLPPLLIAYLIAELAFLALVGAIALRRRLA